MHNLHKKPHETNDALMGVQDLHLKELVMYARRKSSYYQELYKSLPDGIDDIQQLPVTTRPELMAHFDQWVTDPAVKMKDVLDFVNSSETIGKKFLDKYTIATTSGTTGKRGIFLIDDAAFAVNMTLSRRAVTSWLTPQDYFKILRKGGRLAIIAAEGHVLVYAGINRLRQSSGLARKVVRTFSVFDPVPVLVDQLNDFQPAMLISYGGVLSMLASEQSAGRLHISPVFAQPAGETLSTEERARISQNFQTKVRDVYGSTECPFLTRDCAYGWYHVNSEWVIAEPVDENYQPVPAGQISHTVLLSNLANHVQPIIRYDLGDKVMLRPDACPCGNPRPALKVQGRAADILTFERMDGERIELTAIVFIALMTHIPEVVTFQIIQTDTASLHVRLLSMSEKNIDDVGRHVQKAIRELLIKNDLENIIVKLDQEPPQQTPGGKFRTIIPLQEENHG